ncbi:MAG: small ribosomal subunit Rsm22 family protein [Desulfovibrio sp.]|jgi:hypothetical protein|nr:small ribosomal subunit Rsm22 family protein [Desulfovibrio sp.]
MSAAKRNPDVSSPLFSPLPPAARRVFALLPEALERVRPLNAAQRRALPEDAAELSRLLTVERAALRRSYWLSPAFVSAYLYYFLPWNLLRLARLFASLSLPDPRSSAPGEALLVDVGSGPLTLPIALWMARPDLGDAPLGVFALDSAPQPLELGKSLFRTLGGMTGRRIWPLFTERACFGGQAVRPGRGLNRRFAGGHARPWLVAAANALNEIRARPGRKRAFGESSGDDGDCGPGGGGTPPAGIPHFLFPLAAASGSEAPALLVVEPGTRLGGRTIMALREQAGKSGFRALAPCPHNAVCPLLESRTRAWCHFTFDCAGAPDWLERLSGEAGLAKTSLGLSFLLLRREGAAREDKKPSGGGLNGETRISARVLSAPFAVPGLAGGARYACCAKGLLLLEDAAALPQGELLRIRLAKNAPRDAKSGALVVRTRPPGC